MFEHEHCFVAVQEDTGRRKNLLVKDMGIYLFIKAFNERFGYDPIILSSIAVAEYDWEALAENWDVNYLFEQ